MSTTGSTGPQDSSCSSKDTFVIRFPGLSTSLFPHLVVFKIYFRERVGGGKGTGRGGREYQADFPLSMELEVGLHPRIPRLGPELKTRRTLNQLSHSGTPPIWCFFDLRISTDNHLYPYTGQYSLDIHPTRPSFGLVFWTTT